MELEEAKKICNDFIDENRSRKIILHEAIETLLQAQENSIIIDLIENKMKELEKEEKKELKGMKGQDRYYTKQMYMYRKMILKELLQDKKEKKW